MIKTVMLMILDGFGINPNHQSNAVALADMPVYKGLLKKCPNSILYASELEVGLPEGQMGNSEVGHVNIGSGRIVYQDLQRINKDIDSGDFFGNKVLVEAIEKAKEKDKALHIMGLASDGGVHSHIRHLKAILECAKRKGISGDKVFLHLFLDGRDTPPSSGVKYVQEIQDLITEKGIGKIATIGGRYYGMDRDKRWDRIEKAYRAMCFGEGNQFASAINAIEESYRQEIFDEFVVPSVIVKKGEKPSTIEDGDSVVFFNFRPDRARQITQSLVDPYFNEFETKNIKINMVTMTNYDSQIKNVKHMYEEEELVNVFGEYISKKGLKQLRIAETEKYAHVTFFFNGGREKPYEGEDRILVPSPKVATYDLKPEMSAEEVTDNVVKQILLKKYDSIILNYANPDMVGHTGNLNATIEALETIDKCIGRVVEAIKETDGVLIIIADHGNCEKMIDYETGEPYTAHTTNVVPIVLVNYDAKIRPGKLSDVAPTMLEIMGLEKPAEMTGTSLIEG